MSQTDLAAVSDQELAARAQKRDQDCIATLYDRYYDRIYRFALARLRNHDDAEDLAQETFLKMVDKLNTFRWQGIPFSAWLFRIAHNAVLDFLRRQARRGTPVPVEQVVLPSETELELQVERSLAKEQVLETIRGLTPAQQEVLAMRFGGGLSVNETAKALGKAEGTIKATQFQAFQALRRTLLVEEAL